MLVKIKERLLRFAASENGTLISLMLFGLLLRLYKVTNPFLDHHGWRQSDTAAIARNFLNNGFNILYPQVDFYGAGPGYVETEFQLVPYLTSLFYWFLGPHDVIARLVVIAFSIGSIYLFYRLVRKYFDRKVTTFSTLFFVITPLNIYFSRSFQPESAMLFFSIAALVFFNDWLEKGSRRWFALAALCTSLAILVKIPTLLLGFPLLWMAYSRYGKELFKQWKLYLFAILVLTPPALWYYYANTVLGQWGTFAIWDFGSEGTKWGSIEVLLSRTFWGSLYLRFTRYILLPIGLALFIIGLFMPVTSRKEYVFHFWLLGVAAYFILVAKGNMTHPYYQLPIVPVASVFVGKALAKVPFTITKLGKSLVAVLLLVNFISGISWLLPLYEINMPQYIAGRAVDNIAQEDALIITGDGQSRELLYQTNRKGWVTGGDEHTTIEELESNRKQGAKYYVTTIADSYSAEFKTYLYENSQLIIGNQFVIYDLTKPKLPDEYLTSNPNIRYPSNINFGNKILFLGYDTGSTRRVGQQRVFEVTYYWQCLKRMSQDYQVFVYFLDQDGKTVFQQDHEPAYGAFSTNRWSEGDMIKEQYMVVIPDEVSSGSYSIWIGIGLPDDQERLPVLNGGALAQDDKMLIGQIDIE